MEYSVDITKETLQDILYLKAGLFKPLTGFMNENQFRLCINECLFNKEEPWSIPINLEVNFDLYSKLENGSVLILKQNGRIVAKCTVESKYLITDDDLFKLYKTFESAHPGVYKERERGLQRIGGSIELLINFPEDLLTPQKIKKIIAQNGWKTIVGFQTRNPVHRAHEHLHRVALENYDALFINPLIGWKKKGDFSEEAVINGYKAQIETYYPKKKILFDVLKTQMRYAGPREALFHALVRRNLGCTHFIVGRDHAGVGNYYGIYEAQEFVRQMELKVPLGINILTPKEPVFCKKCDAMVSEASCGHSSEMHLQISGTLIRSKLAAGEFPDEKFMRTEVSKEIVKLGDGMFIL